MTDWFDTKNNFKRSFGNFELRSPDSQKVGPQNENANGKKKKKYLFLVLIFRWILTAALTVFVLIGWYRSCKFPI